MTRTTFIASFVALLGIATIAYAQTTQPRPQTPIASFLGIMTIHNNSEAELANTVRVNPADFVAAVQQLTGVTPVAGATTYDITVRVIADPAHNKGFWTFDKEAR